MACYTTAMDEGYTLQELSEQSGLEPRVIRAYIEQGLLRGAETRGRHARYSRAHLERLLAIRALREGRGMALSGIRRTLLAASDEEVRALGGRIVAPDSPAPVFGSASALDYLRSIGHTRQEAGTALAPASVPRRAGSPVEQLLVELERLARNSSVPRQARGEPWFRIAITPDIELGIRGAHSEEDLAQLERIADHLRAFLLGGIEHDRT